MLRIRDDRRDNVPVFASQITIGPVSVGGRQPTAVRAPSRETVGIGDSRTTTICCFQIPNARVIECDASSIRAELGTNSHSPIDQPTVSWPLVVSQIFSS